MANAQTALGSANHPEMWSRSSTESHRDLRSKDHVFFTSMAFVMAIGVFGGFARTYFARSFFHSPQIPLWVHLHGAVFTAWVLFYVMQNLLALKGGIKLHRNLGVTGAILASAVVALGLGITARAARQGRFLPFPDTYSLIAVTSAQMGLFALFITLGLLWKRDSESHKRLMHMSFQLFFFPAFGRLLGLGPLTLALALALFCAGPVYDWFTRGRVQPTYKWGVPLLIITMPPFSVIASHAPLWRHAVDLILP